MSLYRRIPARAQDWFTPQEIEESTRYQQPLRRIAFAEAALSAAILARVIFTALGHRILRSIAGGDWRTGTVAVTTAVLALEAAISLPFSLWRTFSHNRRWGFTTQRLPAFLKDLAVAFALGAVIAGALMLGLIWLIRATRAWWILAWLGYSAFSAFMAFAAPVVVFPLFNRFRPLEDQGLRQAALGLAASAGVPVSEVLVMDASRRTTKHNAFFAGVGKTRRIVLWDTLLSGFEPAETLSVVAHEVGHWSRRHVLKGLALTSALSLASMAALRLALGWNPLVSAAGASGGGDPVIIPLVLGIAGLAELAGLPISRWVSRAWERQADQDSLALTRDAGTFLAMERALAVRNRADLAPSRLRYLLLSHPPPPERMALARGWAGAGAVPPLQYGA